MKENQPHHSQEQGLLDDFVPKFTRASAGKGLPTISSTGVFFYVFLYLFGYALLSIDYDLSFILKKIGSLVY
jgi:hypothetical protein